MPSGKAEPPFPLLFICCSQKDADDVLPTNNFLKKIDLSEPQVVIVRAVYVSKLVNKILLDDNGFNWAYYAVIYPKGGLYVD